MVEMAVTLAIIAIIVAAGAPALADFVASQAAQAEADELASTLRQARSEAMKRGMEITVCSGKQLESGSATCLGTTDWSAGWVSFMDHDGNGTQDSGESALRVFASPTGLKSVTSSAKSVTLARTGILLFADGAAVGAGVSHRFLITPRSGSDRGVRTVCLGKQGRVTVSRGTVSC